MMSTIALALGQDAFRNPWAPFFSSGFLFFGLALLVIAIIGGWKVFEKAGQPGWAILIPFFNLYILLKIAGRPGWWVLLYFIPLVSILIAAVVAIDIAKAFGQSALWGFILIFLLGGIGCLILGFGDYRYLGPQT
jgi:hypothetical protein